MWRMNAVARSRPRFTVRAALRRTLVPRLRLEQAHRRLSIDSQLAQRSRHSLAVEVLDGTVDCGIEGGGVGEGLMGQGMGFEVAPDRLDVVEFRRISRQPLDGEPVRAGGQRRERALAGVDRAVVFDQHDRLDRLTWLGTIEPVELLEMGDEGGGGLGWGGVGGPVP